MIKTLLRVLKEYPTKRTWNHRAPLMPSKIFWLPIERDWTDTNTNIGINIAFFKILNTGKYIICFILPISCFVHCVVIHSFHSGIKERNCANSHLGLIINKITYECCYFLFVKILHKNSFYEKAYSLWNVFYRKRCHLEKFLHLNQKVIVKFTTITKNIK